MENKLPNKPGVYLFKDAANTIIYVGKATCLRQRVASYFHNKNKDWKIDSLLAEHRSVEHIITSTEMEAALLEAHLIRLYQPKYNVLLKSGQPFIYILFTDNELPTMELVRNKKQKGKYYGPFLQKRPARAAFNYLEKTFRLRLCTTKISNGCLDYHIGICAGNCRKDFDLEDYKVRLQLASNVLKKDHASFLATAQEQIKQYSQRLEFEKARTLAEYITNMEAIFRTLELRFNPQKYSAALDAITVPTRFMPDHTIAKQMQDFFGLAKPIVHIDCFDISHFQSTHLVGSCIRFSYGIPEHNKFRRFKIRSIKQQNDYAALTEIVTRRYKDQEELPDLILIDGGKGQLHTIQALKLAVPCISLAKNPDRIFSERYPEGIPLDIKTPIGKLCTCLRDYAHHFAIDYHRKRAIREF